MLDQHFCDFLAFKLDNALALSDNEDVKGFWCDGIYLSEPDKNYSLKFVNDNTQVILKAYIGKDGQNMYYLNFLFGRESLSKYAQNLDNQLLPHYDQFKKMD